MKRFLRVTPENYEAMQDFITVQSTETYTPDTTVVLKEFGVPIPAGTTEIAVVVDEHYDGPWELTDG
jgi:hypothetical protein